MDVIERLRLLMPVLCAFASLTSLFACSGGSPSPTPISMSASVAPSATSNPSSVEQSIATTKSAKRGIAYDLASFGDVAAISAGASWWYDYSLKPSASLPANITTLEAMDFVPMLFNGSFDDATVAAYLSAHSSIHYLLVLNEPNLTNQANMTPQAAAALWPRYEAIAARAHVKIVGPAMTWGTMPNYQDPVVWLDAFFAAYRATNGRDPVVDYLAFHWYDYGLAAQLDRLTKYGKPLWVTEFANWHSQNDGAQIDTLAGQQSQMTDMVGTLEARSDVFRYAWFTGRISPDPHFESLFGAPGTLTALGKLYLQLPRT